MNDDTPLELELHGYVDGLLDSDSMARVERYLRANPEEAAKVRDYLEQKHELAAAARSAGAPEVSADVRRLEKRLARRLRRGGFLWLRSVAAAMLFVGAGWLGHSAYVPLVEGPSYADELVEAYRLSLEVPEEIMSISSERMHRLFQRLGEAERLPDLAALGFEPVGAQLLPSDAGPVLHVPYRNAQGTTISFFLMHTTEAREDPQHVLHRRGVTMVHWQHSHSNFALAAPLDDEEVQRIAARIDRALGV